MIEKIKNPFLLKLFLFRKLPLAYFAGLRLKSIDDTSCSISVPFNWMTSNPFRSMYFAAQSMAAEFSTALLAVKAIEESGRNIALIIVGIRAEFEKKAQSRVLFTCEEGVKVKDAVSQIQSDGDTSIVEAKSVGRDKNGEVVSVFHVTWSFKDRN